jgi:hypothetical protein
MSAPPKIQWPGNKQFAFTVFDDPDGQRLADTQTIYGYLKDLGFRTTKGVWPLAARREASDPGLTCGDPAYVRELLSLQAAGFEMGYHNATSHTSTREETLEGLLRFAELFGHKPKVMAHHYFCQENLYWGEGRVSGWRRAAYNLLTRFRNRDSYGHLAGHPYYWGDLCREHITYVRSFVFPEINTLRSCNFFPYHDPDRPFVNFWYAGTEAANRELCLKALTEEKQDRLEEEGGLCILYTHFGHYYYENGVLAPRFKELMARLAKKNGWFAPAGTILDYLREKQGDHVITPVERSRMERAWLGEKLLHGTS